MGVWLRIRPAYIKEFVLANSNGAPHQCFWSLHFFCCRQWCVLASWSNKSQSTIAFAGALVVDWQPFLATAESVCNRPLVAAEGLHARNLYVLAPECLPGPGGP